MKVSPLVASEHEGIIDDSSGDTTADRAKDGGPEPRFEDEIRHRIFTIIQNATYQYW